MGTAMKPKLGQSVYILIFSYDKTVAFKETVGYLGKNSFVVEDYAVYNEEYQERYYEDQGRTWFASLKDLKEAYPNTKYSRSGGCYVLEESE